MMDLDVPIIGILRGIEGSFFRDLMEVAFSAGLQAIEITMNTSGATEIVAACRNSVPDGKYLGIGTVRCLDEARAAIDCGAMYLVTPNVDVRVIEYCRSINFPVFAGALTPTEVYTAWSAGADMVKIFPCGIGGPQYIKELKGPLDHVPMLAVGGVNIHNIREYMTCGADGAGVGASLFGRGSLADRNLQEIGENVKSFVGML